MRREYEGNRKKRRGRKIRKGQRECSIEDRQHETGSCRHGGDVDSSDA